MSIIKLTITALGLGLILSTAAISSEDSRINILEGRMSRAIEIIVQQQEQINYLKSKQDQLIRNQKRLESDIQTIERYHI